MQIHNVRMTAKAAVMSSAFATTVIASSDDERTAKKAIVSTNSAAMTPSRAPSKNVRRALTRRAPGRAKNRWR